MFELGIKVDFPAAHHLVGYPGDCARPHGHNWTLEVRVRAKEIDPLGMAVDFRVLKAATREITATWDHQDLNTLKDFEGLNPSAENLAKIAYRKLSQIFQVPGVSIYTVTIWENDRCWATYFEEPVSADRRTV